MNQRLFELMCKHYNQEDCLSSNMDFIDSFIETVVNFKGLYAYVKDVKIKKFLVEENKKGQKSINHFCFAKYDGNEKSIYVYLESIKKAFLEHTKNWNLLTSFERALYFYYELGEILLHELDHAVQEKEMHNNKNQSFEINLLRICTAEIHSLILSQTYSKMDASAYHRLSSSAKEQFPYMYKKYVKLYQYSPEERLANINACNEMQKVLSYGGRKVSNLTRLTQLRELRYKLGGYKEEIQKKKVSGAYYFSPTIAYLQAGREGEYTEYDNYTDQFIQNLYLSKHRFSLDERLKYGLMISENEFNRVSENIRAKRR